MEVIMKKVLIIEDNVDNLKIMRYALQRAGYDVISTERGETGYELAVKESPFFIIMDINLPGIDGMETTRKIKESSKHSDIPIIAVTSYAMAGDREKVIKAGCSGYIEKPIDPISLVEQIHAIIGKGETG
jgi:two-component system, cell cycle response regulator DivK